MRERQHRMEVKAAGPETAEEQSKEAKAVELEATRRLK